MKSILLYFTLMACCTENQVPILSPRSVIAVVLGYLLAISNYQSVSQMSEYLTAQGHESIIAEII